MYVWDEMCENNDLEYFFTNPDIVPMMWTGLVDSNGTYVYDGDVVRVSHDRYEYEVPDWDDEDETHHEVEEAKSWPILVQYEQQYGRWSIDALSMNLEKRYPEQANFRGEVVGNIWQNPELTPSPPQQAGE